MKKIRILLAKVGLDGHDRGIKIVAHYLMQAGMEVIYLGLRSTPEQVVSAALDEDVEVVGLSFLAGDHMILAPRVVEALRRKGLDDVKVIVGGIILKHDIPRLEAIGVRKVFLPGTPPGEIVQFIQEGAAT
ncbi:MAG TPA: cobalamin B12-binding domain-containing protein [Burkholderiales bacterium]